MADRLITAFDDCLAGLERGLSLEESLRRYPDIAEALRPRLQTFIRLQSLVSALQPPPGAQEASRARFLLQAETKLTGRPAEMETARPKETSLRPGSLPPASHNRPGRAAISARRSLAPQAGQMTWLLQLLNRRAAAAFAALAVVLLAVTGVLNASAESLPGSPLYGIKQVIEDAQLLISPGAESRARLEGTFGEQHYQEARQVTERGWNVPLEFGGLLDTIDGDRWSVEGITVRVTEGTAVKGRPDIGLYVDVRGTAQPDHTVLASRVEVEGEVFRGRVDRIETGLWLIDGRKIFVSAATSEEGNPKAGDVVEVSVRPTSDGNLLALKIRLITPGAPGPDSGRQSEPPEDRGSNPDATQTSGSDDSQTETAEPTRPSGGDDNLSPTLESTGQSDDDGRSGKTPEPSRTPSMKNEGGLAPTETPHRDGDAKPVEPTQTPRPSETQAPTQTPNSGGSTVNPTSSSPVKTKFQGVLQAIGGDTWLVAGQSVLVTAATAVEDNPVVGDNVEVEANVQADGSLVATRIRVKK